MHFFQLISCRKTFVRRCKLEIFDHFYPLLIARAKKVKAQESLAGHTDKKTAKKKYNIVRRKEE
jgi:hypothetical protein